jgi:hypothetical protein
MTRDRLDAYRSFVDAAVREREQPRDGEEDGYLFDEPRCRFRPEPSDELVAPPGAEVTRTPDGVCVQLPSGARLPLVGCDFDLLRKLFAQLPCSYSRLTIELGAATESFMQQAFSRVMFAPTAVAQLETELSAVEIVRFPGSPYEVVRQYWQNAIAVRRRLSELELPRSSDELRALLLDLHELLLMGEADAESRSSFYLPASKLSRKRPMPGSFYEVPSGVERRGSETILTGGARVNVRLLGGDHYWQLLAESVDDSGALADERQVSMGELDWGQVVRGRAADEKESRPWFLPPRPLEEAHFDDLLTELRVAAAAESACDVPAALRALAAFHYRFVRLHPLPSGNQSLSMSFVNAALRRLLGIGIPHLLLDQMALRFTLPAYQKLFLRAARAWAPWPNVPKAEQLRHLIRMRGELNEFVSQLGRATSLVEARARLLDDPRGATLALLSEA